MLQQVRVTVPVGRTARSTRAVRPGPGGLATSLTDASWAARGAGTADQQVVFDSRTAAPGVEIPHAAMFLFLQQDVGPLEDIPPMDARTPSTVTERDARVKYSPVGLTPAGCPALRAALTPA